MATLNATSSSSTLSDGVEADVESQIREPSTRSIPHWRLVASQALITDEVLNHKYKGSGTTEDPYVVEFIRHDPRNPLEWSGSKKWFITLTMAIATLAVSFVASAFSGGVKQVIDEFHCSQEVATLGISLFVLGFALGPLIWAPCSELYGRQVLFFGTYAMLTIFNGAAAGSNSITTLLVLRFLAGTFGSSPLTNAGGVIADMFQANERGLALSIFAAAPFLGPVIGPIVGGFSSQALGFRFLEGLMAIFTGFLWLVGALTIPETYAPVLLKRRAAALAKRTGKAYVSIIERRQGKQSPAAAFKKALTRPWALLFLEPIVLLISIYMAIIYGTLFLLFGAYPIVFQQGRGWSQGVGGLAFLGVAVGMISGTAYTIFDNRRYKRVEQAYGGAPPPEQGRLPPGMIGAVAIPIGMFWFAWTNSPSIHWIVCIIGSVPFGFGNVMVFLPCMNYLIDAYTIYAASVLAASSVLRSLFGAAFPLFTSQMYDALGIHWASSVPAFLALACAPFLFVFYKYGERIRMKCKYAAQAHEVMEQLRLSRLKTNDEPPAPAAVVDEK
ncbi:uncharacterized protein A1O9_01626 [Exophiala aquamarina CBS 119918]|uniref:Major facilitator superfamily (MFS) profile domain-containing protein n=1 Tax=Exophiala aquamarina CBS 119918 TaxID=1182545 RepID=A0A072PW97_9EURO|nr:uncharacterized protein A1O9_01626 [Exophiala aquamarina CBS 119918]KEF63648.1 hypothetical protein A1O9_01626 [Exophiala aquamarina CBS 119918]